MNISLSSFIYLNYPLGEALERIAQAGYDGIDIWGGRPHAYRKDLNHTQISKLAEQSRALGLTVASFIPAQFRYPTCLCSPSDKVRRDSVNYIKDGLDAAAEFGAPLVSVCPGHTLFGQELKDGWDRLLDSLNEICSAASRLGLRVALEPADKYETDLVNTCAQAIQVIEDSGLDNLGVVLDNGHSYVVGERAEEVVRRLGDHLYHVHLDDNNGRRDQHLIPGDGNFDFIPFLAALRDCGYSGFLTAELSWDYTIDPDQAARAANTRVREYLQAVEGSVSAGKR